MARFLLAIYLLTSLVGHGSFVMCEEPDSGLALESLLQPCCGIEDQDNSPATEECDCRDLSGSLLFTHLPRSSAAALQIPALLPLDLPEPGAPAAAELPGGRPLAIAADRTRPDLPGGGSCPRVLRA